MAGHYGINWKTVAGILHRVVEWGLKRRRKKPLRIIGLDEVSRKKGHRYLTLVYDLERGELVWVGKDRTGGDGGRVLRRTGRASQPVIWRRSAWTCGGRTSTR